MQSIFRMPSLLDTFLLPRQLHSLLIHPLTDLLCQGFDLTPAFYGNIFKLNWKEKELNAFLFVENILPPCKCVGCVLSHRDSSHYLECVHLQRSIALNRKKPEKYLEYINVTLVILSTLEKQYSALIQWAWFVFQCIATYLAFAFPTYSYLLTLSLHRYL